MSKGFTFIELIVATGIMLSLVGFGAASYVNFNEHQLLEQAAKNLKNTMRVAQQNAVSGVKDNTICTDPVTGKVQTFRGWCMSPKRDSTGPTTPGNTFNSYEIYGVCDTDEGVTTTAPVAFPSESNIDPVTLPEGISLTTRSFSPNAVGGGQNKIHVYEENSDNSRTRFNVFGNDVRLADDTFTKVVYCLQGSFPSLGNQNIYQITIQKSGEINDDGFVNACATL